MIPNDCVTRFIFRCAWLLLFVIALTPSRWASATPMLEGGGGKGLAWGPGVTINVFIPPDNNGRDALIKEGIERWKDRLAAHGRTLKVTIGAVPAGQEKKFPSSCAPSPTATLLPIRRCRKLVRRIKVVSTASARQKLTALATPSEAARSTSAAVCPAATTVPLPKTRGSKTRQSTKWLMP